MQEVYIRHASPIQPTKTVADKMALLIEPADSCLSRLVPMPQAKESWPGNRGAPEAHNKMATNTCTCIYVHCTCGSLILSVVCCSRV